MIKRFFPIVAAACFLCGLLPLACKTLKKDTSSVRSTEPAVEDPYLDPEYEAAWSPACDANRFDKQACDKVRSRDLGEQIASEKKAIAEVRQVIKNFVESQAMERRKMYQEYLTLDQKLNDGKLDAAQRALHGKRHANLKRLFGDLPKRRSFATRDVHRKSNGCLAASFTVKPDLDPSLSKGLFSPGREFEAIVRYSNGNPKAQSDYTPDARGMAVKLLPPNSLNSDPSSTIKYWLGKHGNKTAINPDTINRQGLLDILTINFPVFFVNDPPVYAEVNKAFLEITDNENAFLEHKFSDFSAVYLKGMTSWEKTLALNVNGSIIYNPLYVKYYSMAPSRLGDPSDSERTAVKYIWNPCKQTESTTPSWSRINKYAYPLSGPISQWWNAIPEDVKKNRNHLRQMIAKTLGPDNREPVCYELQVQKFLDPVSTPIEDASAVWLESDIQRREWHSLEDMAEHEKTRLGKAKVSAPMVVGRLMIQPLPDEELEQKDENGHRATKNAQYCEDLSFNPWNNVPAAHRPLGIVQRMKKQVYNGSRESRFKENHVNDPFISNSAGNSR